ncbi:nucleoside monophosphate kinase [Candidatus Pacearchaeota archaeon]|nr:nucleoside monophosphate kinase [Candidatus Pacearchaeota archaeon]
MKLVFIGPPASGKGTQAKIISEKLGLAHISTGDLLRNVSDLELKSKIDFYLKKGELVPDEIILNILKKRLLQKDSQKGFILDGFPRTLKQAELLNKEVEVDKFIGIKLSDEEVIKRLASRLTCKKCGAVYNSITNPPKQKGVCDICGSSDLVVREDDKEDSIIERLKIYHKNTEPILKKFHAIIVNGEQEIEKVTEDILKFLDKN